jgi:multidrug transporter EmrE-like cation transporter
MPAGIILTLSILSEVAATLALRASDGFSRPLPAAIVVIGYAASFVGLALVLRHMEVSAVYAIWAGSGTALVAVIGMLALGDATTALKVGSIALIVAGVVGLNLSRVH